MNIARKIIKAHLLEGEMIPGQEIGLRVDQTLTQDATGTMAWLQFEALGLPSVRTELSVSYVDHNTLQMGFRNPDDHRFLRTAAQRFGAVYSAPGTGICHQLHLENFARPGRILIGSDSHTPNAGGMGCLSMGAGGLSVALAMAGEPYNIPMPKVVKVWLTGRLTGWAQAKDVILHMLSRLSVKGGVGRIFEYCGPGVATLSVPERATITNMGAELGATTSVFPSDDVTKAFLKAQDREEDWVELKADEDAVYDKVVEINLSELVPMAAMPHMPDNVKSVDEIGEITIDQVCIGSCTNSSLMDMMKVAHILKGKKIHPNVSLSIAPGSKQVLTMLAENGALADMIAAGARILESACGPCIGMGQSPNSKGVSLRTFNRNFEGRSGTADAGIYLVSPEVAAISAVTGVLTNPAKALGDMPVFPMPEKFLINDNMVELPATTETANAVDIIYGPNIKSVPLGTALTESVSTKVMLKVGDNITTDHIMPAGAKILPYRSNVPHLSQFCFRQCDEDFAENCKKMGGGIIVGGANYGQGSSREHAALVPLYLGIKAVVAKSFARLHKANLINSGIIPLTFKNAEDYDKIDKFDVVTLTDVKSAIINDTDVVLVNETKGEEYILKGGFSERQKNMLTFGGLLNYTGANK